MNRSTLWGLGIVGLLSLTWSFASGGPTAPAGEEKPPAPAVHKVERGTLTPCGALEGVLGAPERVGVYLRFEQFGGPLIVVEAVPAGRAVRKGDVLIRFESRDHAEAMRGATEALDHAEAGLAATKAERELLDRQQKEQRKATDLALWQAEREYDAWMKHECASNLKSAELGVKSSEHSLADQKEELAQLESMYRKSELAGETKEIVLDRARRSVMMAEEYLKLARTSETVTKTYENPDKTKSLTETLDQRRQASALEATEAALARDRKDRELLKADQEARDAREAVQKLKRDQERLVVTAPCAGILVHDGVLAHAGPEAIRWCADGATVRVTPAAWPEKDFGGKIRWVSAAPSAGGDPASPKYEVRVTLEAEKEMLRLGMPCRLRVEGAAIREALWVPKTAVASKDGKSYVKVSAAGKTTSREVTCGPSNETQVQIVKGLQGGEEVVVPEVDGAE
ncbi:MAG: hypothetical protein HYY93_11475 [Planctomycetes bacterium]|nr:hypothetical protein [Planctomycetota bacterium]